MSEAIGKLSINNLNGKLFIIPFYQRGYRWTANEAKRLFSDLLEFEESTGESEYCLQPIVLQPVKEQKNYEGFSQGLYNEKLLVVDGQQRLTTIAILLDALGVERKWEIYYKAEKNILSKLLRNNDTNNQPINYYFREKVRDAFDRCSNDKKDVIRRLLDNPRKSIVFLRYDISPEVQKDEKEGYEGHNAFLRLNAGKTPLTSSELIRALYMVNASGLSLQERMEISKEWEIIENTLRDEQFWLMFNSEGLSKTQTRIDLLFALVKDVSLREAKANPRIVFERMDAEENGKDLRTTWVSVLRCFWWMQSCYADVELFNYLCWIREFTENSAKTIYDKWRYYPKMEDFKVSIIKIIQKRYEGKEFNKFDYNCNKNELRALFVLLNLLDCNKSKERFRFDLYKNKSWDIEHIDSRTPNELTDVDSQKEWLLNSYNELSKEGQHSFDDFCRQKMLKKERIQSLKHFQIMAEEILALFNQSLGEEKIKNQDALGNLALLNTSINRSYKNAIFPVKRKTIKGFINNGDCYVPPCTAKAFMKFYTESPSKITHWLQVDFENYSEQMKKYFDDFMKISLALPKPPSLENDERKGNGTKSKQATKSISPDAFHFPCKNYIDTNTSNQERLSGAVSFTDFMDKYNVVIPKIQRLYVQGRLDSNGKKSLSGFAYHLVDCVSNNKDCTLDFVYGIDDKCGKTMTFYPLDGQQRLTTLLLLAWLCGENKDKQWGFQYDSRRATECFIKGLLSHDPPRLVMPDNYEQQKENYQKEDHKGYLPLCSDAIKKSDWFLTTWQNDAGIAGMLEMLDSLYCKLLDTKKQGFDFEKITFFVNYLDADCDSYDQIFLKMNSRGKPLTEWENVKAVLDMNAPEEAIKNDWQEKLNNTWQENLWNKLDKNEDSINKLDTKMLSVVELALSCVGYDESTKNNTFMLSNWLEQKENTEKKNEFYDICDKFFSAINIVDGQNALIPIWNGNNEIVPDFTAENDSNNRFYKPLLVYYAGTERRSTNCDWMRVVWNIAENAGIDRSNFRFAYMLIKELSQHANDILDFLAGDENINRIESQFAKAQIAEERLKARLIQIDEQWKNRIIYAESLPFIKGRINVLLDASKNENHDCIIDIFNNLLEICNIKFPTQENENQKREILENSYKDYFAFADEKDLPFNCKNPFSFDTVKGNFFSTVKPGVKRWLKHLLSRGNELYAQHSQEKTWNKNLCDHWSELKPLNGNRIDVYKHGWGNNKIFVFNMSDIRGANLISPSRRQELIEVLQKLGLEDKDVDVWARGHYDYFSTIKSNPCFQFVHHPDDGLELFLYKDSLGRGEILEHETISLIDCNIEQTIKELCSRINFKTIEDA